MTLSGIISIVKNCFIDSTDMPVEVAQATTKRIIKCFYKIVSTPINDPLSSKINSFSFIDPYELKKGPPTPVDSEYAIFHYSPNCQILTRGGFSS